MHEKLPRVDWMVGTGLVALAILSVFYGSAELTSNIAAGLIGFLGRTVAGREGCVSQEMRHKNTVFSDDAGADVRHTVCEKDDRTRDVSAPHSGRMIQVPQGINKQEMQR